MILMLILDNLKMTGSEDKEREVKVPIVFRWHSKG